MSTMKREIASIDRNVDDLDTLLAGLRPDVQPIVLSDDEPAQRQMARAVQGRGRPLRTTSIMVFRSPPGREQPRSPTHLPPIPCL
jgi:hypothetical protein